MAESDTFEHKQVDSDQVARMRVIRDGCTHLEVFVKNLPKGREQALALTKLEEFAMWANKAISRSN